MFTFVEALKNFSAENDSFLFLPKFCYRFDWSGGRDLYKHHHTIPALLLLYKQLQMLKSVAFGLLITSINH